MSSKPSIHSSRTVLDYARGDALQESETLRPEAVRMVLDALSASVGDLAYCPEIRARAEEVLQQKFDTDEGNDLFNVPNYAPYVNDELAAFYGVDNREDDDIQTRRETLVEQRDRLVADTARALEPELPGFVQMMDHFATEEWARHGTSNELPYVHENPDVTLFRNPDGGWNTIDRPVATSDKRNIINLYDAQPTHTFPRQHPAWLVDEPGAYYDRLE